MDLEYGERYEQLRREVRAFLDANGKKAPGAVQIDEREQRRAEISAWQDLLIEKGYAARTIPREYGGYGAEPDPLDTVILDEEFNRAGVPRALGGVGPSMLVPTLLEHGTEEQKLRYVGPTLHGQMPWCQGIWP